MVYVYTSLETQGQFVRAGRRNRGQNLEQRKFTSRLRGACPGLLVAIYPVILRPVPTNYLCVSEDGRSKDRDLLTMVALLCPKEKTSHLPHGTH